MKIFSVIFILLVMAALGNNPPEQQTSMFNTPRNFSHKDIQKANKESLESDGEYIGRLKNGSELRRYVIYNGDYKANHYIYTVDNVTTINHTSNDKLKKNNIEVIINNKKYEEVE